MKVTIEIDEEKIADAVREIVIQNAVEQIEKDVYGEGYNRYHKHVYVDAIKDAVRETVKKNAEDIIGRAVECGGTYIGKKGLKKMIDEGTI